MRPPLAGHIHRLSRIGIARSRSPDSQPDNPDSRAAAHSGRLPAIRPGNPRAQRGARWNRADHAAHPGGVSRHRSRAVTRPFAAGRGVRSRPAGHRPRLHAGRRWSATPPGHRSTQSGSDHGRPTRRCSTPTSSSAPTSARSPVFDSTLLRDDAVVVAVGSHESDAREFDAPLLGRATVIVEDVATALREAGDVVLAICRRHAVCSRPRADARRPDRRRRPARRPSSGLQSVGMSWQDLVVAAAVVRSSVG